MYRLLIYPRGYSRVVDTAGTANTLPTVSREVLRPTRIDEDADVERTLRLYLGQDESTDWAIRRKEIATCSKLYGVFQNWVEFQLARNAYVYDMSLDFLLDTLHFIAKGTRNMAPQAWKELLERQPAVRPDEASEGRIALASDLLKEINWSNFMAQWISQPDGYDDMVFSTYVFFGKL